MNTRIVTLAEYKQIKKANHMYSSDTDTITGTYGSGKTPCDIYTYSTNFGTWYAVEGSQNVNFTYDELTDGVDVEEVSDHDFFTYSSGINSEEELRAAVEA